MVSGGRGWFGKIADGFKWIVLDGCRWFWVVAGCSGWSWVVFCFSSYGFYIYRRRNKPLETVASMLHFGALERSSNLYIESVVEPCVSQN